MVLLTALITLGFEIAMPFQLTLRGMVQPLAFVLLLGGLSAFYRRCRPNERISAMLTAMQQVALFSAVGVVLSYMVAARAGPFWDASFAAWDRALGLDWLGWLGWLDAHPLVALSLKLAYISLIPQMVAIIVLLGLTGSFAALRITVLAAMIAGLTTILLSGLAPGLTTYAHFGLSPGDYPHLTPAAPFSHVADLTALRAGTLRILVVDQLQGIITFPSYHGALAVVFGWGFSRAPFAWLRWPGMLLAGMTLAATPVDGGHYFVDVMAGALIAAASLWIASRSVHLRLWTVGPSGRGATLRVRVARG
jgi:hypothetical protein